MYITLKDGLNNFCSMDPLQNPQNLKDVETERLPVHLYCYLACSHLIELNKTFRQCDV